MAWRGHDADSTASAFASVGYGDFRIEGHGRRQKTIHRSFSTTLQDRASAHRMTKLRYPQVRPNFPDIGDVVAQVISTTTTSISVFPNRSLWGRTWFQHFSTEKDTGEWGRGTAI